MAKKPKKAPRTVPHVSFTCGVCGYPGTPLSACMKRGHGSHHAYCCPG